MSDDDNSKSFWATLPGILTGVAALLTAVGGLLTVIDLPGPNNPADEPLTNNSIPKPPVDEPLKINSFSLDYTTILRGDSSNLSWSVSGAKKVNILPGTLQVGPEGFLRVSPETTTEYSITAMNGTEQLAASVRLEVWDVYPYAKGNMTLEVNGLAQGRGIDLDINTADTDHNNSDRVFDLTYGGYFKTPFTVDLGIIPVYGATIVSNESGYPFWPGGLGIKVAPETDIDISNWPEEKYIWVNTNQGGWSKVSIHKTLGKWSGTVNMSYITWHRFSMGS